MNGDEWGELKVVQGPWGGPSITLEFGCQKGETPCPGPWCHYSHNHLQDVLMNLSKKQARKLYEELKRFI